jgi:hypothetical protein
MIDASAGKSGLFHRNERTPEMITRELEERHNIE